MERISAEETYRLLRRQGALNFTPGVEHLYSNSGYFLLSEIVKTASGQSLKDFAREHIFDPLGMSQTRLLDDVRDLIENRAFAYYAKESGSGFSNAIRRFELVGSGGVYSTVLDLYKWDQNFYDNKLGNGDQAIIEKMYTEGTLNDGTPIRYAFGLETDPYNGLRMIDHGGSHGGFKAQFRRFPDQKFSVIVLANRSDANVDGISLRLADLFLGDLYGAARSGAVRNLEALSPATIEMGTDALEELTGHYLYQDGTVRQILLQNDTLFYGERASSQAALRPVAPDEFKFANPGSSGFMRTRSVQFGENEDGTRTVFLVLNGRVSTKGLKFEPVTYGRDELKRFEGPYFSSDLDVLYRLRLEGDKLVLFVDDKRTSPLTVIAENILRNNDYGVLRFERATNREVEGFTLDASRIRGLRFLKQ